ncbi:ArfGap-domain-containing protein [Fomitiporia mediterranea MF3/22]|uniref:ArfGap-domain-containing protein n=1 Tax=Fomitiporia mediterranea (strain MF3/22) TaxID=694068 RepID=UPI0004407899|nr:ArfGap-domain-containing protein [Fomitiporia mediterranea MF3/22]EJD05324.1 ArfGap-domain-containing protein [Fomitiporia mediterranea MF3/22]
MSASRASGVSKIAAEKHHRILLELVSQPGNDICADCKAKAPRWASHNLGIFICVRCASIHRKIGTHVTKVKSLTLDDWSKEQVENMKTIGNVRANAYWNPDETKHPLPTNMEESERDSELEKYIRSKYQFQRFRPLGARAAEKLGPSQSLQSRTPMPSAQPSSTVVPPIRSQTAPIRSDIAAESSRTAPPVPSAPVMDARSLSSGSGFIGTGARIELPARRSSYNPFPSSATATASTPSSSFATSAPAPPPNQQASLTSSTFNDLISLQAPSLNSSLPLQYSQSPTQQVQPQPFQSSLATGLNQAPTLSPPFASSPFNTPTGGMTNPYANLALNAAPTGSPFASVNNPNSSFRSASLPTAGYGQSPLNTMPTGSSPGSFSQPFNPSPNPFTQMQGQTQQYPGMSVANYNNSSTLPSQPSGTFFPAPGSQGQQGPFQPGPFQSSANMQAAYGGQGQHPQQPFQGMQGGGGVNNPFAQWGGT